MAAKPIPLDVAAKMLGMSEDDLANAQSRNEILSVRGTGSVTKFKLEELQRYADGEGINVDMSLLQAGGPSDGGTVAIDPPAADPSLSDSLVLDDDLLGSSELVLELDEDASRKMPGEMTGSDVLLGDEAEPGDSGSDTGKMLGGEDDLLLAEDDLFDDGDLSLSDDGDISLDSDSDLEDSDLVLDEDSSSEIALSAEDSGINLSPTDSGLSLDEESVEFEGSDIDALELPEDDDMIEIDGDLADSDAATQLRADEDFILTPVEESMDDESSGSQVIDLESSEIYVDESSSGMFGEGESEEEVAPAALVAEDAEMFQPEVGGGGMAATPVAAAAPVAQVPEAPYSIFNILALVMVLFFVTMGSLISIDVVRNMWQYDGEIGVTSTLMDFVIQMVGINPENPN